MTQIEGLAAEIQQYLQTYYSLISDKVENASKVVANDLAKTLKTSPLSPDKTGGYKKGWKVKRKTVRGMPIFIVHNKTDYQLTHLLEKGHALRRGGRTVGHTREFQHIKPAAEQAFDTYLDTLKGIIEQ